MSNPITWEDFIKLSDWCYEIPSSYRTDMRVPARIFLTKQMFEDVAGDRSLEQLVNLLDIVSNDLDLSTEFTQVLNQIEGE